MNQMNLNDAIDGAGRRLQPEVDRIVDTAMADGTRQVRRRRRGTALVAFAAIAAVGVGGGWWLQRPDEPNRVSVSDPGLYAAGPGDTAPNQSRQRADADDIRADLLAMLPDGDVTDVVVREDESGSNWDGSQLGVEVNLKLDGVPVRLNLIDFNRDAAAVKAEWSKKPGPRPEGCEPGTEFPAIAGDPPSAALTDCAMWNENTKLYDCATAPSCARLDKFVSFSPKQEVCNYDANHPCRELPNGDWIAAGRGGDDLDSEKPFTMANRFTADGWYIYASSENEPNDVLDVDQVSDIVLSDAWFK